MASTGSPFTREEWNDLVQQVNDKINEDHEDEVHKDDGDRPCDPPEEIQEAEEDHIWTRSDIEDMRTALEDMCPNFEMDDMDEPDQLWKTWLIDQIEDGISQAWCDCEKDECECEERDINVYTVPTSCSPQGCGVVWCPSEGHPGCEYPECNLDDWANIGYAGTCPVTAGAWAVFSLWWVRPICTSNVFTGDCGRHDGANAYHRDGGSVNCHDGCIAHRDERLAQWGIQDECTIGYPPVPATGGACRQTCYDSPRAPCKPCTIRLERCFLWWCHNVPCVLGGVVVCGEEPPGYCDSYDCSEASCQCKVNNPDYWEIRISCIEDYDDDGMVPCYDNCCDGYISGESYPDECGICPDECGQWMGADAGGCCWVACECDEDNEGCELPEDDPDTCWDEKRCFCKDTGHEDFADEDPCSCEDCPCGECGPCPEDNGNGPP